MSPEGSNGAAKNRDHWSCPTCASDGVREFRPFCSAQCADRDLGRWLDGSYVVPGNDRPGASEIDEDEEV